MTQKLEAKPWPNGRGWKIYLGDSLLAEVHDSPELPWMMVETLDAGGEVDLVLSIPGKIDPITAVSRCLFEGLPPEEFERQRLASPEPAPTPTTNGHANGRKPRRSKGRQ